MLFQQSDGIMDDFYEECILISSKFFIIFLMKQKTFSFEMHIKIVCRMGGSYCCLSSFLNDEFIKILKSNGALESTAHFLLKT